MAPKKYSEKDMQAHRDYMKKYQKASSDLHKEKLKYKDHYDLLGLSREATHNDVRKAYRMLALKFHPDRNSSAEAQERWEGVPAAYAVLSDPNSRTEYDATLPTRDALVAFYKSYNPAKLDNATIQTIIDGWYGREVELFEMLNLKYEISPHQGVNRRATASEPLSATKARDIARDSLASTTKDGEVAMDATWMESVGSAFCCKRVYQRFVSVPYYEVQTQSPGIAMARQSDTPGQPAMMRSNLQSPAPLPSDKLSGGGGSSSNSTGSGSQKRTPTGKTDVSPDNASTATVTTDDDHEAQAATTSSGGSSLVDDSRCSSTTSTASTVDTPVK